MFGVPIIIASCGNFNEYSKHMFYKNPFTVLVNKYPPFLFSCLSGVYIYMEMYMLRVVSFWVMKRKRRQIVALDIICVHPFMLT